MKPEKKVIIIMSSVHETLEMEDHLEARGISFRSVVKPRSLGTDCGIALKVARNDVDAVIQIANAAKRTLFGIFVEQDGCWQKLDFK